MADGFVNQTAERMRAAREAEAKARAERPTPQGAAVMLKRLISQIKTLFSSKEDETFPQQVHKPQKKKREYVTPFRATWDVLRERRKEAGLLTSGETRRVLRAHIKRRLSRVRV